MQEIVPDYLSQNNSENTISEPLNQKQVILQIPPQKNNIFSKKIAIIVALVILISLLVFSILVLFINPSDKSQNTQEKSTENDNSEFVSLLSDTKNYPNQLKFSNLVIPYPEDWTPIFGRSQDGIKSVVYLATSDEEASYLSNCTLLENCKEYSVKLIGLNSIGISRFGRSSDVSSEMLIAERLPDLKINALQKNSKPDKTTWSGYTNEEQSEHTMVITTSEVATDSAYYLMTSATTQPSKKYLQEFIAGLDNLQVTSQSDYLPKSLNSKYVYNLEIKSSYITEDTFTFTNILQTFLTPKDLATNYDYFLYKDYADVYTNPFPQEEFARRGLLNDRYYLLTDNDEIGDQVVITPQLNISIKKHDNPNLGMYLSDRKFCLEDTDCSYRPDICTMGAYNAYAQVNITFGCGPSSYVDLSKEENDSLFYCLDGADVTYDEIKCISNRCELINPAATCAVEAPRNAQ